MYAIFEDGGRQYKVEEGQELEVDYREVSAGDKITFDRVLAVRAEESLKLGTPMLSGASVTAEVVTVTAGPKLYIQKFRRRKTFRKRTGHRQLYTKVKIQSISAG